MKTFYFGLLAIIAAIGLIIAVYTVHKASDENLAGNRDINKNSFGANGRTRDEYIAALLALAGRFERHEDMGYRGYRDGEWARRHGASEVYRRIESVKQRPEWP